MICALGDGGALMTGQELAVAQARGAAIKLLLSDNGSYGSIRIHQERQHPGAVSGTDLTNPDMAQMVRGVQDAGAAGREPGGFSGAGGRPGRARAFRGGGADEPAIDPAAMMAMTMAACSVSAARPASVRP